MHYGQFRQKFYDNKGAVSILVAVALTALLGMTALVVDVGLVYYHDVKLANAVDAAALAGVQALPDNPELASRLARDYAVKNGVPAEKVTIEISPDNRRIYVQATRTVNYFFAQALGFSSTDVARRAGAEVGYLAAAVGVVPFCIEEQELVYNEEYVLKSGSGGGGTQHSGWFGALRLGGNGVSVYENNLKTGYQKEIKIGDLLEMENGNMSGPTTRGVNYRIAQCNHDPACTSTSYDPACPRLITVPVCEVTGKKTVKVKGFAKFFLEGVDGQGKNNNVWGTFLQIHDLGKMTDEENADYGIYSSRLSY